VGGFIVDEVVGKHEFITYPAEINADGSVKQIEIMEALAEICSVRRVDTAVLKRTGMGVLELSCWSPADF
jgi:hypothetical protein